MAAVQPPEASSAATASLSEQRIEAEVGGIAVFDSPDADEVTVADEKEKELAEMKLRWPGWPGCSVFRIVVPVLKVGSIIGKKGDLIKKLVEETRAKIRVLDGPQSSPDRIVLVFGKEEPEVTISPAMDAILRIFKRVNGLPENDSGGQLLGAAAVAFCSIRLLIASTQAISLIGKQGSVIKAIQENTGASVRVHSNEELPIYAGSDERVVEVQGEALKVLNALEAVVGHLRKFLVDHSVVPLFEKSYNATFTQEKQVEAWSDKSLLRTTTPHTSQGTDYLVKRDPLFLDRDEPIESRIPSSRLSLYGSDFGLGNRSSIIGRSGEPIVTQIIQTMQVPLAYAEDIIGVQGANIEYIRRTSGAVLTVQESRGLPEEITVEIKGTSSQVQIAQQLIREFTSGPRETLPSSYGKLETSLRLPYSQLGSSTYSPPSSSLVTHSYPYRSYGSSGFGGYSNLRY